MAPACTFEQADWLEVGAVSRIETNSDARAAFGPSLKVSLPLPHGDVYLGFAGSALWDTERSRPREAAFVVPVTWQAAGNVAIHANVGVQWFRDGRDAAFFGAQVEWTVISRVLLMGECFATTADAAGCQGGVRWQPADWADVDLLIAGQKHVGAVLTLGLTVRFEP